MIGIAEMLRCAKELGFKARTRKTKWDRLAGMPLPGIAALRNGGFLLVAKVAQNKAMVAHPRSSHIETISRAQFEAIWDGRLVLMTRHNSLSDLARGLVRPFANMAEEGMRRLARRNRQYLTRRVPDADQDPIDPAIETAGTGPKKSDDTGLTALVMLLRCHGIGAEPGQIRHRCGTATIGITEMLRCAKELGLKASAHTTNWERLAKTPLPGIAALRDGGF